MRSSRYYLRLTLAFLVKFRLHIIFSVSIGVGAFFIVNSLVKNMDHNKNQVIGITGRFHPDTLPVSILDEVSTGLTKLSDEKTLLPAIAQSWENSENGKVWTFKIKPGLVWHDGTAVTSRNLVYEFSDVTTDTPDDNTLVFKVDNSFAPFPAVVSKPTYKTGLVGVGDWQADKITLSGSYVSELILKKEKQTKTYRFFPTTESTKTAFKLGKINIIEGLLDPSPFDKWQSVTVEKQIINDQVVTLFFNTRSAALSEKELRQALTYAINKEGLGERAFSPIQPTSWAYNPQVKTYEYDPEKSRTTVGDMEKERKTDIKISLVSSPSLLSIAEKLAKDWEAAGVTTSLLVSSIIPQEYDAYLTIYDIPTDPDQYSLWHSTQTSSNISKYTNPRIDKLLEDGRSTVDFEERKRIYFDFQRFILEDLPAAFLIHPAYYTVKRK